MLRGLWTLPSPSMAQFRVSTISKLLAPITAKYGKTGENISNCSRCFSSDTDEKVQQPLPGQVFKHERHNLYICWHPEVPFPYEMTKPIDTDAPVAHSHLKIQALTPVREAFRKKHQKLMVQELVKLTYATKHRFFGMHGMSKRRFLRSMDPKKQKRNREYL